MHSTAAAAVLGLCLVACGAGSSVVRPDDPQLAVMGRVDRTRADRLRMGYPGVTLRLAFEGPSLRMLTSCTTAASHVDVIVDGGEPRVLHLPRGDAEVTLAGALPAGLHTVDVIHRNETWQGVVAVRGFVLGPQGRVRTPKPWPARRMLFIGDSVTCGEAIDRTPDCKNDPGAWSARRSYGVLLARALDAQAHLVCFGGRGLIRDWRGKRNVLNAPQFFDAAVPDERAPPPWDHAAYVPDVVVVSLGTNDFNLDLGPLPAREEFVTAYVAFVRAIRARYPDAYLFLTEGAIVSDDADPARPQKTVLRAYIDETVRRLGDAKVRAVPSKHYEGDACNKHPTREQHAQMARDLEPVIRAATGW